MLAWLLVALALGSELLSVAIMFTTSNLFAAVINQHSVKFWSQVMLAMLLVSLQALIVGSQSYVTGLLALRWRFSLVSSLHVSLAALLERESQYLQSFGKQISNQDQRVSQDADSLTLCLAQILQKVAILPFTFSFYTVYLIVYFGWSVPFYCFLYFNLGYWLCWILSLRIAPYIYRQGQLEGDFRLTHTSLMQEWVSILLLQGGEAELEQASRDFEALASNQKQVLLKQYHLGLATQWFAYAGSIVAYIIIGGSIFSLSSTTDDGSAKVWLIWSRGTYACFALVNAFSFATDTLSLYGKATGYARRLLDVYNTANGVFVSNKADGINENGLWTFWRAWRLKEKGGFSRNNGKRCTSSSTSEEGEIEIRLQNCNGYQPLSLDLKEKLLPVDSMTNTKENPLQQKEAFVVHNSDELLRIENQDISIVEYPSHVLIPKISLIVSVGMRLLIRGPAGCGKSTLLAFMTQISRRNGSVRVLSLPQRPYILSGASVADNLAYPGTFLSCSEAQQATAHTILHGCGLSSLSLMAKVLSPGQQQCLAIARLLFTAQSISVGASQVRMLVLLDEATSAMDEETEETIYRALQLRFPSFISVGHRSSIRRFHTHELLLGGNMNGPTVQSIS